MILITMPSLAVTTTGCPLLQPAACSGDARFKVFYFADDIRYSKVTEIRKAAIGRRNAEPRTDSADRTNWWFVDPQDFRFHDA
jgi:hypothetical protein